MRITQTTNETLQEDFTPEEIKDALDAIGDLKAPGPDGLPTIFFKKILGCAWRQVDS